MLNTFCYFLLTYYLQIFTYFVCLFFSLSFFLNTFLLMYYLQRKLAHIIINIHTISSLFLHIFKLKIIIILHNLYICKYVSVAVCTSCRWQSARVRCSLRYRVSQHSIVVAPITVTELHCLCLT